MFIGDTIDIDSFTLLGFKRNLCGEAFHVDSYREVIKVEEAKAVQYFLVTGLVDEREIILIFE